VAPILLDTTVLLDVLRGGAAVDRLRALRNRGQFPFICAINADEVWRGATRADEAAIARLLQGLRIVPLGLAEGERAGRWRRDFAARGLTLGQADCLIAAAAVTIDAPLATSNVKDFPMTEVRVEDWSA
jgi:predicted nucleic acid-binding protein